MASEKALGETKKMESILEGWKDVNSEVLHYLSQGVDHFTVFAGPWTLTFDNTEAKQ